MFVKVTTGSYGAAQNYGIVNQTIINELYLYVI